MDIIEVESYNNIVYPGEYFDAEKYEASKEIIFNQLDNLNNLGQDLISELDLDLAAKNKLYLDIINFIKENYIKSTGYCYTKVVFRHSICLIQHEKLRSNPDYQVTPNQLFKIL